VHLPGQDATERDGILDLRYKSVNRSVCPGGCRMILEAPESCPAVVYFTLPVASPL